jgi:hypothetical protein
MATVNTRRVALGALAGGLVWSIWSTIVNLVILEPRYALAQSSGTMLKQARYPWLLVYWFVTIFLLAYVVAWLYSSVRATRGAGPGTALTVGLLVGFAAGFPHEPERRHVVAHEPPLAALVDARPLARCNLCVARGRLALQRLEGGLWRPLPSLP